MKILLGTHNKGKIKEIGKILSALPIEIIVLPEKDNEEPEENGKTYFENALKKAKFYADKYKIPTLADDSGLEIEALNGKPGIHSARFLGENTPFDVKIEKILELMQNKTNRKACFKTVAVLYFPETGKILTAKGKVNGEILFSPQKKIGSGFGYDPIFNPNGFKESFSMLGEKVKNKISHRARALKELRKLIEKEIMEVKNDRDKD